MEWDTRLKKPQLLGGGGTVPGILLVLDDQGGGCIRWNYNELSPALRARMNGHPPVVVMENESSNDDRIRAVPIDGTGRTD